MKARIRIDHEEYGTETHDFTSIDEAQRTIRACGPDFYRVTLHQMGTRVVNEDGQIVGWLLQGGR